jgi:hypothetical protein
MMVTYKGGRKAAARDAATRHAVRRRGGKAI